MWPFRNAKTPVRSKADVESAREIADIASKVVSAYDDYLQAHPLTVSTYRDLSKLTIPKDVILRSLLIELALESNEDTKDYLRFLAFTLSQFLEGVGPRDLSPKSFEQSEMDAMNDDELLSRMADHQPTFERWKGFVAAHELELKRISGVLMQSSKP